METQSKTLIFARWWVSFKAGPGKLRNKMVEAAKSTKELAKDDPRRIIHSLKVGIAFTLVSLFYYWKPVYDGFGASGISAVITVVVLFEFTVGETLSKGLNRGLGTLLAGALGIGANYLADLLPGEKGQHIVLGFFVFLTAASATFSRFFPKIKARYDYGVLVFVVTFSMVCVSGFRVDELLTTAQQTLSSILAGGAICISVSIFVYPVWAGKTLQDSIASNIQELASFLEGFGGEYFHCPEDGDKNITKMNINEKDQGYKTVLDSKSTEDSMADFARWEPRHGKLKFRHPWKLYLNIGSLTRQCAYQIDVLNGYLTSDLQTSLQFRRMIKESCTTLSSESGKTLRELATAIETMTDPTSSSNLHLNTAKSAIIQLKDSLKTATSALNSDSDLLAIIPDATVACLLIEVVKSVEKLSESVGELAVRAQFKAVEAAPLLQNRGSADHVVITVEGPEIVDWPENLKASPVLILAGVKICKWSKELKLRIGRQISRLRR